MPKPIKVPIKGEEGYRLRLKAKKLTEKIKVKGPEAGSREEQSYGILAETVIRKKLNLPPIDPEKPPLGFDIMLPSGVRMDVKCRSGKKAFQVKYKGTGNVPREAKHNFFARQVFDPKLKTDIYLMTHLETPSKKSKLPGTKRQRKWRLYICGWVSKSRVEKEGVFLPRGSLTERGRGWFPYRSNEIEFYHRHLNDLSEVKDLSKISLKDVKKDVEKSGNLHLTSVDAVRITADLVACGILSKEILDTLRDRFGSQGSLIPRFHPNQYFHLIRWLIYKDIIGEEKVKELKKIMSEKKYSIGDK